MMEKGIECPECHYTWYKYYKKAEPAQPEDLFPLYHSVEVPVVIITPLGYFCRLCRHEWRKSGMPIEQEEIDKNIISFRKHGKALKEEMKSIPEQDKSPRKRDRNEGFIPR